jgi:hypothetical protein
MKLKVYVLVLLATVSGWRAESEIASGVSSGGVLEGPAVTPAQQAAIDQANYQWQRQQAAADAQKAAAQAAAYAQQVAGYNNLSSEEAARFAGIAANLANQAVQMAASAAPIYSPASIEQVALQTKQTAASAKQEAGQAEMDAEVAKLEKKRDAAVAKAKAKYDVDMLDLESQVSTLRGKETELESQLSDSEKESAHIRARQLFQPKDPWRKLDGTVCSAKEDSWVQFTGTILQVKPNGILVHGDFGPPLEPGYGERDYFVENFPVQAYPMADDETITAQMNLVAHVSEKSSVYQFTNSTIDLRVRTVRRLDYGTIVIAPPPDLARKWTTPIIASDSNPIIAGQLKNNLQEQLAIQLKLLKLESDCEKECEPIIAEYQKRISDLPNELAKQAKEKEVTQKQAIVDKVLKNNEDLAGKGDAYGLLRMGERYRDGEGVPKDLAKAKQYLQKAVTAGSPEAADELKTLPN